MSFGMVSRVGRGTGALDVGGDRRSEGAVLREVNVGHSVVTNADFVA